MQQRKPSSSVYGRPSGTDGSDFSYRMVVDSRYTRVAKGKSQLAVLIIAQVVILFLGIFYILSTQKDDEMINKVALLSTAAGQISLIIGELGRRRSRVNFLKFYMAVSSSTVVISSACAVKDNPLLKDPTAWQSMKMELVGFMGAVIGLVVQVFTITTTVALTTNMSPPTRAS